MPRDKDTSEEPSIEKRNEENKDDVYVPDFDALTKKFEALIQEKQKETEYVKPNQKKQGSSLTTQLFNREIGLAKNTKINADLKEYCYIAINNRNMQLSDEAIQEILFNSLKDEEESIVLTYLLNEKAYPSAERSLKMAQEKMKDNSFERKTINDLLVFKIEGNHEDVTKQLSDPLGSPPKIYEVSNLDKSRVFNVQELEKNFEPKKPDFFS